MTTVLEGRQPRRGTAAAWTSANTVLAQGEVGFETDTGKFKIGDGSTAWTSLGYIDADLDAGLIPNTPSGNLAAATVQGALDELQTDVDTRLLSADVLDEDDFVSDSATKPPSQQSVKAYANATHAPDKSTRAALGLDRIAVYDTFNRADAGSLGTSDSGHAWSNLISTWSVVSNAAKPAASANACAVVDSGLGNGRVAANLNVASGDLPGVAFRVQDSGNLLFVTARADNGNVQLWKRVSSSNTSLAAFASSVKANWGRLEVMFTEDFVVVLWNGRSVITHTLSAGDFTAFPTSLTKQGIIAGGVDDTSRWDDFIVSTV